MKLIKLNIQNLYGVYTVQYKSLSCVRLFATPSTVAHLAPLSMEFSRQEYWSRLPFPFPGGLPDPGIKSFMSPVRQMESLSLNHLGSSFYIYIYIYTHIYIHTQFSSVAQSCPILCNLMNCSMPGLPVHHQLPESTQTYVH